MKDVEKVAEELVNWIKEKVKDAGCKGVVLGISGGIDSAVVAAAAKRAFPEDTLGIIMPCKSSDKDEIDAMKVIDALNINYKKVVLDNVFDSFISEVDHTYDKMAIANIKPRLRMTTLYYYAAMKGYLVAGTGNKSELTVGYFTKHGDSGVDMLPIASFVKRDVFRLAEYFNIPEEIINKAPSAGLWEDQTDEDEMGITYKELDEYILTGDAKDEVKDKIDLLNYRSAHKRSYPPIFTPSK
nr:NAD(+) synthase [Clostridium cylindrosporum]